jgi:hypothetical protein
MSIFSRILKSKQSLHHFKMAYSELTKSLHRVKLACLEETKSLHRLKMAYLEETKSLHRFKLASTRSEPSKPSTVLFLPKKYCSFVASASGFTTDGD